jgi:hypothetical protein
MTSSKKNRDRWTKRWLRGEFNEEEQKKIKEVDKKLNDFDKEK